MNFEEELKKARKDWMFYNRILRSEEGCREWLEKKLEETKVKAEACRIAIRKDKEGFWA